MKKYAFRVVGMKCEGCLKKTQAALKAVPGVKDVNIDLATGASEVEAEDFLAEAELSNAVMGVGFAYLPL